MKIVIVESPAKAKTIEKYLGKDFQVLASYGHVRDLIPKEGAVDPEHDFAMHYEIIERNQRHVQAISKALKGAENLYLATDPDREGDRGPLSGGGAARGDRGGGRGRGHRLAHRARTGDEVRVARVVAVDRVRAVDDRERPG